MNRYDTSYSSHVHVTTLGRYLDTVKNKSQMVHIVSDNFYIHAPAYCFYTDLRSLLGFEVTYNEYFPYTLYL